MPLQQVTRAFVNRLVVQNDGNIMRKMHLSAVLFVTAAGFAFSDAVRSAPPPISGVSRAMTDEIELNGTASGGVLVLAIWNRPEYVSVETKSGESAESVVNRLAAKINAGDPFHWWGDRSKVDWRPGESGGVKAVGNTLSGLGSGMILTGTEQGLGIPKPPLFLSGSYDPEKKQVVLQWVNPAQEHDRIQCSGKRLAPGTSVCTFELREFGDRSIDALPLPVVIMRGKTPSCAGLITVRTNAQEELNYIPFYNGVMPNWATWSTSPVPSAAEFAQGVKDHVRPNRFLGVAQPDQKPYFQILKTRGPQVKAGIWRKFLNLKPGHTYQISARLNTLGMDAHTDPWSYSLHAAYNESDGRDFTVEQLAGAKPLPDGQVGEDAGRIASYGRGSAT